MATSRTRPTLPWSPPSSTSSTHRDTVAVNDTLTVTAARPGEVSVAMGLAKTTRPSTTSAAARAPAGCGHLPDRRLDFIVARAICADKPDQLTPTTDGPIRNET